MEYFPKKIVVIIRLVINYKTIRGGLQKNDKRHVSSNCY